MGTAVENVLSWTPRVAEYCEQAVDYDGFRIF
jgi:hypothetical protein